MTTIDLASTARRSNEIVVVDDDADLRTVLEMALRMDDWRVTATSDGVVGLDCMVRLAEQGEPPTVLLDIQMPDLDGWQVLRLIRADPRLVEIPVLLCTVVAGRAAHERGYALGADGFITKPFDIATMLAEVAFVSARTPEDRVLERDRRITALARSA